MKVGGSPFNSSLKGISWAPGCDFPKSDIFLIEPTRLIVQNQCEFKCNHHKECTHFSWSVHYPYLFGSCKMFKNKVTKANAIAVPDKNTFCAILHKP